MDASTIATNNGSVSLSKEKGGKRDTQAKYNLRTKSIQNRIEVDRRKNEPRHPKPKQRPAPLSKYRRRTANFRERCRMQEMNDAFKRLQSAVPDMFSGEEQPPASSSAVLGKGTKINTLKLAVNYISALTQMLTQPDAEGSLSLENNENMRITSCGQSNKNKCHTFAASTSHSEVSRNRDLSARMCHLGNSQQKVPHFEFDNKPKTDSHLIESNNVFCAQQSSCGLSVYDFEEHLNPSHFASNSAHCSNSIVNNVSTNSSHCHMNNFELTYSLSNDGQNLLDDFSALIDDLHEDNFCLVDDLIE